MRVSLILPVYNSYKFLNDCVRSILNQTFVDFELIMVDDGSTDKSLELCQEWSTKDKRIKVYHQNNLGPSAARNSGIRIANGQWIVFVDSDDKVLPTYLSEMYKIVSNHEDVDLCISGLQVFRGGVAREKISFPELICNTSDYDTLFNHLSIYKHGFSVGKMYKKSIIDKYSIHFNNDVNIAEDCLFMMNYITVCSTFKESKIAFIDRCNYCYMIRKGSLSTTVSSYEQELYSYNEYKNTLLKLKNALNIRDYVFDHLCSSLPFFLDRVIRAIYKEKSSGNRISKLKTLEIDVYKKYKRAATKTEFILTYLLVYHQWYLYDCIRKLIK